MNSELSPEGNFIAPPEQLLGVGLESDFSLETSTFRHKS